MWKPFEFRAFRSAAALEHAAERQARVDQRTTAILTKGVPKLMEEAANANKGRFKVELKSVADGFNHDLKLGRQIAHQVADEMSAQGYEAHVSKLRELRARNPIRLDDHPALVVVKVPKS